MKNWIFILFFTIYFQSSFGQSSFFGQLYDTSKTVTAVNHATVMLLRAHDSILVQYSLSNTDGKFLIKAKPGHYILMIIHPNYADYYDSIEVDTNQLIPINIYMMTKAVALKEFIFKQKKGAIVFKGDTIEYHADSFKSSNTKTVEDLLKKLPGIQVGKGGIIKAQGETVKQVFVDGEEFFGEDPTVATQNIKAEAIDKIQVYDQETKESQATGISNGEKDKVLNLKLKEEYKKGMFGKLKLAGGTPLWYENSMMLNAFKGKRKVSVYSFYTNTYTDDLDWDEQRDYGASGSISMDEESFGMTYFRSESDQEFGFNNGLPNNLNTGVHFSNKYNNDRLGLNINYNNKIQQSKGNNSDINKSFLGDSSFSQTNAESFEAQRMMNHINLNLSYKTDSFTTIKLNGEFATNHKESILNESSSTLGPQEILSNSIIKTNTNNRDFAQYNWGFDYKRTFRKRNRVLKLVYDFNQSKDQNDGNLFSQNSIYNLGILSKQDTIDQLKKFNQQISGHDVVASFSEPISKYMILQTSYQFNIDQSVRSNFSYNKILGIYSSDYDSLYSNQYKFQINTHAPGVNLKFQKKKNTLNIGGSLLYNQYTQNNITIDSSVQYKYINFRANSNYHYKINNSSSFRAEYIGKLNQPSIEQIQTIRNNYNPFYITEGNPNLLPSFTNRLMLNYNSYQMIGERSLYISINSRLTSNDFVNSSVIDNYGRTISKTVNAQGNYSIQSYAYYGFKLKKNDIRLTYNTNLQRTQSVNIVNDFLNKTQSGRIELSQEIEFQKDEKYEISIKTGVEYNFSNSSITPDQYVRYFIQEYTIDLTWYLPYKIELNTDFNANIRQRTQDFNRNTNMYIWNASLERKVNKKGNLLMSLFVSDILNQNTGFYRSIYSNTIYESLQTVIKRYWLLGFVYEFSQSYKKEGDIDVR